MNTITKNKQSRETLENIVNQAYGEKAALLTYQAFPDGFCNISYCLCLSDGRTVVLKVAAPPSVEMMSCETALMETEVKAMKTAMEHHIKGVPAVYFADFSKTICSGNYFLMELLSGQSYDKAKQEMSQEQREQIEIQIGQWLKKLNEIKGSRFGHFFREDLQRDTWYEAFRLMLERVVEDGIAKEVNLCISPQELLHQLEQDKAYFDEVKEPRMIHFDSWDGNVFVDQNQLVGLIDWERALWAEGLMEDRFRFHNINASILEGYGKEQLTKSERMRCYWYDVYLYLIMMIEGVYRHYEDDGQYQWTSGLLKQVWEKMSASR